MGNKGTGAFVADDVKWKCFQLQVVVIRFYVCVLEKEKGYKNFLDCSVCRYGGSAVILTKLADRFSFVLTAASTKKLIMAKSCPHLV